MYSRFLAVALLAAGVACGQAVSNAEQKGETIKLPDPRLEGTVTVEAALAARRSVRAYADTGLTLTDVGQVLWAAYGLTRPMPDGRSSLRGGLRTAPSAGATFPLEIYLVVGRVADLKPGIYRYRSESHELELLRAGDVREDLAKAALGQAWVERAPATIVWSAVFSRTTDRYGSRGRERYVAMDLGHSAQNVYLQCAAMGLGTVAVGAFTDAEVSRVMGLPRSEEPLYMMPIGRLPAQ